MTESLPILTGSIIDEAMELTLSELCRTCMVHAEVVAGMVEEGLLEPQGDSPADWRFPGTALRRAEVAVRLQRDLQINLAGIALVLDLLEEVSELRTRVRRCDELAHM